MFNDAYDIHDMRADQANAKFRDWLYTELLGEGLTPDEADAILDEGDFDDYRIDYEDRLAYSSDPETYYGVRGIR